MAMTPRLRLGPALLALIAAPALAQTQDESPDGAHGSGGGTAPGASGGVIAGALLAGPIGAILGGMIGAGAGHAAAPPSDVKAYVTAHPAAPIPYAGPLSVGGAVDGEVAWRQTPTNPQYRWANLNGQRVVIDKDTRRIVAIY
jgi:hypothetical protein